MNPIMDKMNNKPSMASVLSAMKSGSPNQIFSQMMQNPNFAQFVNENKGLSEQQIANKYGIDINDIYKLIMR